MSEPMPPMPTVWLADASVLVAAENAHDRAAQQAALAWLDRLWQTRQGRVSSHALLQFYDTVTHAVPQPMSQGDARAVIRRYQTWQPWQTDAATLETAWAVEARHGLALTHCLAVAAAQHSGCGGLLSFELPHGAAYGGVQVADPNRLAPDLGEPDAADRVRRGA